MSGRRTGAFAPRQSAIARSAPAARLLRLSRRRLHRADRLHRDASPLGGARLVRHRQPRAALAGAHGCGAAGRFAAADLERGRMDAATQAGRRQPAGRRAAVAARPLRKLAPRHWRGARSCNLAVWRRDLDRVDGFDASFLGWGREDSDLLIRLMHAGLRRKDGRFATELFISGIPRPTAAIGRQRCAARRGAGSDRARAQHGLSCCRIPPRPANLMSRMSRMFQSILNPPR